MPSAKLMHLPTEGWSLSHTSRHALGVESKSWYFLALVLRLLEHLWFFHTQRGPLVGLYQEHGITPKSGMNLKSCSVLTTVGAVIFGKGHYSSISGSSHPASQVGCFCLCVILPPLTYPYLFQRSHNGGRLPPKIIFKWVLNRNSCSFFMFFLSYLCTFSIGRWYHWNICFKWSPYPLQEFLSSSSLLPHPAWRLTVLCHSHFQESRQCSQRSRIMIFPHKTISFSWQLYLEIHTSKGTWGDDEARDGSRGPAAGPGAEAPLTHERALGRAQHIVGT